MRLVTLMLLCGLAASCSVSNKDKVCDDTQVRKDGECVCKDGLAMKDDECKPVDADDDGHDACVDGAKTGCDCKDDDKSVHPGAADDTCDNVDNNCDGNVDEGCVSEECTGHGYEDRNGTCHCDTGWEGTSCSHKVVTEECSGNGYEDRSGTCHCDSDWEGNDCGDRVDTTAECSGHGYEDNNGDCHCDSGWEGTTCSTRINTTVECNGHGYEDSSNRCRCDIGWEGTSCGTETNTSGPGASNWGESDCSGGIFGILNGSYEVRFTVDAGRSCDKLYAIIGEFGTDANPMGTRWVDTSCYYRRARTLTVSLRENERLERARIAFKCETGSQVIDGAVWSGSGTSVSENMDVTGTYEGSSRPVEPRYRTFRMSNGSVNRGAEHEMTRSGLSMIDIDG